MRIRKANKEDIPFIINLLRQNNLPYEDVSSKVDCFFVGYGEEEPIGIGGLEIYGNYGLLRSLVITNSSRKKGFGKTLCYKIIEYAKKNGGEEIYLLTETATDFFNKLGFKEVNRNTAPLQIQNTTEFKYLCPSTAICMRMKI